MEVEVGAKTPVVDHASVMVEPEIVEQIRKLRDCGFGAKAIASELGIARNTVRRYLRGGEAAAVQRRPRARRLSASQRLEVVRLYNGAADGNAAVVVQMLRQAGVNVGIRTVQRLLAPERLRRRTEGLASVRFETQPGQQMQIDFGQRDVRIAGAIVRVHFIAVVLSYSRRIFAKAFLSERQDDWREGVAEAFAHFGGVPEVILGDNARALVSGRDRQTGAVIFHPAYAGFCRDWGIKPKACWPYRARTKGKTESGVKYVKRNAIARREFASFEALQQHLRDWMTQADLRVHGTTHEQPLLRFERDERSKLRPLPSQPLASREQILRRRVANDAFVDLDTVRYSVPADLVREWVDVEVRSTHVHIRAATRLVASHVRNFEPHAIVVDPAHHASLWRKLQRHQAEQPPTLAAPSILASYGRSLSDYASVLNGASHE